MNLIFKSWVVKKKNSQKQNVVPKCSLTVKYVTISVKLHKYSQNPLTASNLIPALKVASKC